ncbi:hypothetical protein ASPZODRAFT_136840, partial [Penicilliopsis zonata CBS 506.65]
AFRPLPPPPTTLQRHSNVTKPQTTQPRITVRSWYLQQFKSLYHPKETFIMAPDHTCSCGASCQCPAGGCKCPVCLSLAHPECYH